MYITGAYLILAWTWVCSCQICCDFVIVLFAGGAQLHVSHCTCHGPRLVTKFTVVGIGQYWHQRGCVRHHCKELHSHQGWVVDRGWGGGWVLIWDWGFGHFPRHGKLVGVVWIITVEEIVTLYWNVMWEMLNIVFPWKNVMKGSINISKRNLADIGMAQCMNAYTGWQSTQTRSAMHTVICAP